MRYISPFILLFYSLLCCAANYTVDILPIRTDRFVRLGSFHCGRACACSLKSTRLKYGFINKEGKMVIEPNLNPFEGPCGMGDDVNMNFHEGFAVVYLPNGNYSFIDTMGVKMDMEFCFALNFYRGYARVETLDHKFANLSSQGNLVALRKGFPVDRPCSGWLRYKENERYGYVNETGDRFIKPIYDEVGAFCGNYARVVLKGEEMLLDKWGNVCDKNTVVIPCDSCTYAFNIIGSPNRCGYLCILQADTVIPPVYRWCGKFSEGLAAVEDDSVAYLINLKGEKVFRFEKGFSPNDIHNGFIVVRNDKKGTYCLMDTKGEIVLPDKYEFIGPVSEEGIVLTKEQDKRVSKKSVKTIIQGVVLTEGDKGYKYLKIRRND